VVLRLHTTIKAEHHDVGAVVEHWCPGGMTTPLHVQPEDYEAIYGLEGEVTFFADAQSVSLSPGSYIYVPAGTAHAWRGDSDQARVLTLTTSEHADWFRAAGEPARERALPPPGPLDIEKCNAASEITTSSCSEMLPPEGPAT